MVKNSERYVPKFHAELNIESVLIAPLVAASKANVMMLSGQARFLLDYCFSLENGIYKPVMIPMTITKSVIEENDNENFQQTELVFQVPLLCLLPMNSLAVNEIKLNFEMEITSLSSYDAKLKTNLVERKAVLKGRISSGNNMGQKGNRNKKESTNLNVEITAGPLPLPKGVLSIIDLYTNAIQPRPVNKELQ